MLKRKIENTITAWKNKPGHKPLVIMGIRQCGKTFIAQHFAAENYKSVVYMNFIKEPERINAFVGSKDVDKMEAIRRLDNFALEMNKKYGIAMHRGLIPADKKEGELRDRRFANDFVHYDFRNDYVSVNLYFYLKEGRVTFTLEDSSVSEAIRDEGWEAISEKAKDTEGE